jgi:hypothetical protein
MKKLILAGIGVLALSLGTAGALAAPAAVAEQSTAATEILEAPSPGGANGEQVQSGELGQQNQTGDQGQKGEDGPQNQTGDQGQKGEDGQANEGPAAASGAPK